MEDRRVEKALIEVAMNSISSSTGYCIKFIPRTVEEDFIYITRGMGCSSQVGRSGGRQVVSFTRGCLEEVGAIQHEFLHALGFYHENSRADRDEFVWINWKNLLPSAAKDFTIPSDAVTFGLPYDYDSVLHYRHNAFAINSSAPTIIPKQEARGIGQSTSLSVLDILKLKRAYNCPEEAFEKAIGHVFKSTTTRTIAHAEIEPERPLLGWKQMNMSDAECRSLETKNCRRVTYVQNCTTGTFSFYCNHSSTLDKIQLHLEQLKQALPFSPLYIAFAGTTGLNNESLKPVSENLVCLHIVNVTDLSTSILSDLQLPNLLDLTFAFCKNIQIKANTLGFSKLSALTFRYSTISEIEERSFESLINLKTIVFDLGISPSLRQSWIDHLWRLHCSSKYRWLRAYLKQHPELIQPRKKGEIINVPGIDNIELSRRMIYYPVDCAKDDLTGDPDQIEFSLNAKDSCFFCFW